MDLKPFHALGMAVFVGLSMAAAPADALELRQMQAYAQAFATASQADKACPDIKVDFVKLLDMRMFAEVTPAEAPTLSAEIDSATKTIDAAFEQAGAASWCATTWKLYGPDGTGLLAKK